MHFRSSLDPDSTSLLTGRERKSNATISSTHVSSTASPSGRVQSGQVSSKAGPSVRVQSGQIGSKAGPSVRVQSGQIGSKAGPSVRVQSGQAQSIGKWDREKLRDWMVVKRKERLIEFREQKDSQRKKEKHPYSIPKPVSEIITQM